MVNKNKSDGRLCPRQLLLPFSVDDRPDSVPAAGYRNDTSLNNAGSNGYYWSASPNASNANNAYELNFNSDNFNRNNNNNRYYGQSVRPVSAFAPCGNSAAPACTFSITREQLMLDLYQAYKDARRHKRGRSYQLRFEMRLEENLVGLCDELLTRTYRARPSTCFIVHDPKMREVFAADFRDRVVHHLFYNYTHTLFERTFIADSYSCIAGRGTHYGIRRLEHHIRSASDNYRRPCYVLQVDIKGYFMSISRSTLLRLCRETLARMRRHPSDVEGLTWGARLDYAFVDYLLESIICANPVDGCVVKGDRSDWRTLPPEKSLFHAAEGCGLPIGNLSSQLFSNVYLNVLDQYVKRVLRCRHYGRYVDDAYIVSSDRKCLKRMIPQLSAFLSAELGMTLHPRKVRIADARRGVLFLGAYLRPYRRYVSSDTLRRMRRKLRGLPLSDPHHVRSSVNSFLGVLSHFASYRLRRVLFCRAGGWEGCGTFSRNWLRFRAG